jgi:hypothetical protein
MLVLCALACGNRKQPAADGFAADAPEVRTLSLPEIPDAFTTVEDRAGYMLRHFWDSLNFRTDTALTHDADFMEQNFANYISIITIPDGKVAAATIRHLLGRAQVDPVAYNLLADIAERYLYDPESPMVNEDVYEMFLKSERRDRNTVFTTEERREKVDYQLASIAKNRRGSTATDFEYTDSTGCSTTLMQTQTDGLLLLVFFDPECTDCAESVEVLEDDMVMNRMLHEHELTVLAIDINDDQEAWQRVKRTYPSTWMIGMGSPELYDSEVYMMRNMPSMYLLDSSKTVVLKDASVDDLFSYLCDESDVLTERPERQRVQL